MPKLKNSNATFLKNFNQCAYPIFADGLGQLFFQRLRIYELPILAFFIASDKGNAGRLLPGIFHLFVNLFSFFCYPETLFKAARILPFISCGHIFAFGCLCHFNTLQTLQEQSRDFLFVSSQGTIAISMIFL